MSDPGGFKRSSLTPRSPPNQSSTSESSQNASSKRKRDKTPSPLNAFSLLSNPFGQKKKASKVEFTLENSEDTSEEEENAEIAETESERQSSETIGPKMNQDFLESIKKVFNESFEEKFKKLILPAITAVEDGQKRLQKQFEDNKREKNIIVNGLPEAATEDITKQIALADALFQKIGVKDVMIDDIFRIGKKSTQKTGPRPLLVRLVKMTDKKQIMRAKRTLGKTDSIFINHDLTKEAREQEKLLRDAFKQLKAVDNNLRMGIRRGTMTVWRDGAVFKKLHISREGAVREISESMDSGA